MSEGIRSHLLEIKGAEGAAYFRALASETRVQILNLLATGDRNINELCMALAISQPAVTKHIQALEQAGLVISEYRPGTQGMQKRCRLRYDRLIVSFEGEDESAMRLEEFSMPVGMYSMAVPQPQCGLANREKMIGFLDIPQSFLDPARATAEIIWMSGGFVEYVFPCTLPTSVSLQRLEFIMEVCSEAPNYDHDWPSDITVWINGIEVGTWTCPGDFGAKRGILNPSWWIDHMSQYGMLKIWSLDEEGSYIDGTPAEPITLRDTLVKPGEPITIRIGNKPDANHVGGFNIFGKGFGNYAQDLVLRLHYLMPKDIMMGKQEIDPVKEFEEV